MAAVIDFVHVEQLVDAILASLRDASTGLPGTWLDEKNELLGLKRIEFGMASNWRYSGDDGDRGMEDFVPSILVRFATSDESPPHRLIGGKEAQTTTFSIVHMFGDAQIVDVDDTQDPIQPDRAKAQKAKIVSKALFNFADNNDRRRMGQPELTTADTEAHVLFAEPAGINFFPPEDGSTVAPYAFSVQVEIATLTK